jgi:hypothetical protein
MHLSRQELEKQLQDSEPLSNARGLTPAKALRVVEFYGTGVILSAEIEWVVREGKKSEERLKQFERKFERRFGRTRK